MDKQHPSLHSFEVAPECLRDINRENVCNKHPRNKTDNRSSNPRKTRTIFFIEKCKHNPCRDRYFYQNTQIECFSGDERKEKTVSDNKRSNRKQKERSECHPS